MKKTFLKIRFFLVFFLITTCILQAQIKKPGVMIGGNAKYSSPTGEKFTNKYKYGIGGEVYGGVGLGKTFIIATVGVSGFKSQPNNPNDDLTYIPVQIGLKHFLIAKKLFINGDIGVASVKNKVINESNFTRGIGAGVRLLGLEAAVYYGGWKNKDISGYSNSVDFKVGYSFNL